MKISWHSLKIQIRPQKKVNHWPWNHSAPTWAKPVLAILLFYNILTILTQFYSSQVYGGAISVMVGPYVRSSVQIGNSSSTCGDTICLNCSVDVTGTSISNSEALSSTSGKFAASRVLVHSSGCVHRESCIVSHIILLPKMRSYVVLRQLQWSVCKSGSLRIIAAYIAAPHGCIAGLWRRHIFCRTSLHLEREFFLRSFWSFSRKHCCFRAFGPF